MEYDEALQDIFTVPRILGTFPFDSQFKLSKKWLVYCSLFRILSTFGPVSAFIINPQITEDDDGSSIAFALKSVAVMSALGDNFFILIWWYLKRHRISFLLESISGMQRKNKIILDRQHMRFVHYLLFLTSISCIFSYCTYGTKENILMIILYEFSNFLISSSAMCFVGQFWDILHLMGFLFRENIQLYDESSVINYEKFLTLSEVINEIYGSQVLFTITEHFLQIIVYFYILLLPLFPGFNTSNILIMVQAIKCIMPIVSIILACNYYTNQERNFNDNLRRRMIEEKSRVLLKNEKLNFHFVVARETAFTACGFFNVDMSLICSMISAATTYLVIVLQYSSENHPGSKSSTVSSQHI